MDWSDYEKALVEEPETGIVVDLEGSPEAIHQSENFADAMTKALAAMSDLERGGIANPDEQRRVGHYWLRAPELAPSSRIGREILTMQDAVRTFAAEIRSGERLAPSGKPYQAVLLIGIGGSALGPQFLADALSPVEDRMVIHFLDNTDPVGIRRTLHQVRKDLAETLVLVISKSGETPETRNGMLETRQFMEEAGLNFPAQAVAITGEDSHLHTLARSENWITIFPMWEWVGGRTSVFSAVGLLPAALLGIDTDAFLAGAHSMDISTRNPALAHNPAACMAISWHVLTEGRGQRDMVILPYSDRLVLFSRYLQQLIMESLGKRFDLEGNEVCQGIAVYGNKGSTDQHAYVQQLRDGLDNFFVNFIEILPEQGQAGIRVDGKATSGDYLFGFLEGTKAALTQAGRPHFSLTLPNLSPRTIGGLIALFERVVGLYASLLGINAYHQPGVEAGKKAAARILDLQDRILEIFTRGQGSHTTEEIRLQLGEDVSRALVYRILRHLQHSGRIQSRSESQSPLESVVWTGL